MKNHDPSAQAAACCSSPRANRSSFHIPQKPDIRHREIDAVHPEEQQKRDPEIKPRRRIHARVKIKVSAHIPRDHPADHHRKQRRAQIKQHELLPDEPRHLLRPHADLL